MLRPYLDIYHINNDRFTIIWQFHLRWAFIRINSITSIVSSSILACYGTWKTPGSIIDIIMSTELCSIMKTMSGNSFIAPHSEFILITGNGQLKHIRNLVLAGLCHGMHSLEAIPEISSQVTNKIFIVNPKSYLIHGIICVALYDSPSSIISVHITVDFSKGKGTSPCYGVDTRLRIIFT